MLLVLTEWHYLSLSKQNKTENSMTSENPARVAKLLFFWRLKINKGLKLPWENHHHVFLHHLPLSTFGTESIHTRWLLGLSEKKRNSPQVLVRATKLLSSFKREREKGKIKKYIICKFLRIDSNHIIFGISCQWIKSKVEECNQSLLKVPANVSKSKWITVNVKFCLLQDYKYFWSLSICTDLLIVHILPQIK